MRLIVRPIDYSTRGQVWSAELDGRLIVARSATPFCDAARVLLAEGNDPAAGLTMPCARPSAGRPGLTVKDDSQGKPRFRGWQPYAWRSSVPGSPPVREAELPAKGG